MSQPARAESEPLQGLDALREACARNTPVEVVRKGRNTVDPAGHGRLLELRDDCVIVEKVQVIGRESRYDTGAEIDCFFNVSGTLMHFTGRILAAGQPVRLNQQMVVPSIRISLPENVAPGQRRNVYRVLLGARTDVPRAEVWSGKRMQQLVEAEIEAQTRAALATAPAGTTPVIEPNAVILARLLENTRPEYCGVVADGSDTGLGLTLYNCLYSRLRLFDQIWVRVLLAGQAEPLILFAEVRQTRALPETTARIGVLILKDDAGGPHPSKLRRLINYLNEVQRSQRR